MKEPITIKKLDSIDRDNQTAINHLIYQLDPNILTPTKHHTKKILSSPNSILIVAQNQNQKIIGMISLSTINQIIGKKKALIEDFVVDEKYRNQGIGKKLLFYAINLAKKLSCSHIELTSNPSRLKANNFYIKHGFTIRETNCYRKEI